MLVDIMDIIGSSGCDYEDSPESSPGTASSCDECQGCDYARCQGDSAPPSEGGGGEKRQFLNIISSPYEFGKNKKGLCDESGMAFRPLFPLQAEVMVDRFYRFVPAGGDGIGDTLRGCGEGTGIYRNLPVMGDVANRCGAYERIKRPRGHAGSIRVVMLSPLRDAGNGAAFCGERSRTLVFREKDSGPLATDQFTWCGVVAGARCASNNYPVNARCKKSLHKPLPTELG